MSNIIKQIRNVGTTVVAVPSGEIDLETSPTFYQAIMDVCQSSPPKLVIDLREVGYMDSSGVGTLVEAFRMVKGYGGRLVLLAPSDRVRSMFEIAKLDQFFTITDDEQEALAE
jgi:anti-sigma B factor antagonist